MGQDTDPIRAAHKVGRFLSVLAKNKEYSYLDAIAKATDAPTFLAALAEAVRRAVTLYSGEVNYAPKKEIEFIEDYVVSAKKPSEIVKIGSIIATDALVEGLTIKQGSGSQGGE